MSDGKRKERKITKDLMFSVVVLKYYRRKGETNLDE